MVSLTSDQKQLENGDCSLAIPPPKYKRRKVSAVRDFPPQCGPSAMQIINMQKKEVEGEQNMCEPSKVESEQNICEPSKDFVKFIGEPGNSFHDLEGKRLLEKTVESQSRDITIRSSSFGRATSSLVQSKNVEQIIELPELPADHSSNNLLKELTAEDHKSSKELLKIEEECMTKLEIHDTSEESLQPGSPIALKNAIVPLLKEAGNDIQGKNGVEGIDIQVHLLPHHPIPSSFVWKEQKYPPRRRVSAVRDFPPQCGGNVQKLGETEEKHLGEDKTEANLLKVTDQIGGNFERDDSLRNKTCGVVSGEAGVQLDGLSKSDKDALDKVIMQVSQFGEPTEIKRLEGIYEVKDSEQHERLMGKGDYTGDDDKDMGVSFNRVNKELIVYAKDKYKKKPNVVPSSNIELLENDIAGMQNENLMVIVHGLASAPNCPWQQAKETVKRSPSASNVKRSKRKKHVHVGQHQIKCSSNNSTCNAENLEDSSKMITSNLKEVETKEESGEKNEGDSSDDEDLPDDFLLVRRKPISVTLLPGNAVSSNKRDARSQVREILRFFQVVVRKLLQGEETKTKDKKLKDQVNAGKRLDLQASKILKSHGKCVNTGKKGIIGSVPGVEVGDFFHYRMELSIIGLHRPPQGGIDYLKQGNKIIATSIVASGGYANDVDSSDVLIYTGQGGAKSGDKHPEDQKLERGNLALKNSIDEKNFIRVIRGFKETKPSETGDGKPKTISTYTYDGLYTVDKFWQDLGSHGKLVYKFELRRLSGQPELAWKEVKRSKKFKVREGRCVDDISGGKEKFPICAVNTIDDEKPPEFTYITSMLYPNWCQPLSRSCCDCKDGCSDSEHCACAVKNGGEIPYNYNGAIVEAKPLVYECGPSCNCPSTCHNRVSQCGIKFPLEIFKTESRGWGVRSLSSIPSGSFICEYIGELLDDKEAEERTGSDEYLFDIGQNFNDPTLWDGLSALMPDVTTGSSDVVENVGFTIDAVKYGNVGRFINHSCTPNLYAQNVLYDYDDKRIPHIMLFAAENIPPLQELTYHYNYNMDQVFDPDGNVKKKNCYCGSSECTGRMY